MLLSKGCILNHVQHVVFPLDAPPRGSQAYATGLRIQATVEPEHTAWVVFPFPNAHAQWDAGDPVAVPAGLYGRAMLASAEPCEWRPARAVFASDFAGLVRAVRWDQARRLVDSFDADLAKICAAYPEHGFVAVPLSASGGYEIAWRWYGDAPHACTSWLDDRAPEVQNVIMVGVQQIEWATPGLNDPAPRPQRIDRHLIEAELRPTGRNSDVVGITARRPPGNQINCVVC